MSRSPSAFEEKYKPFEEPLKNKILRILGLPSMKEYLREIWRYGTGKMGLILLSVLIIISISAAITMPSNYVNVWNTASYWEDNPQSVPPTWIKYLGYPVAPHKVTVIPGDEFDYMYNVTKKGYFTIKKPVAYCTAKYELPDEVFPTGVLVKIKKIKVIDRYEVYGISQGARYVMPTIQVVVERPDGIKLIIYEDQPRISDNETINGELFAYVNSYLMIRPDPTYLKIPSNLEQFKTIYNLTIGIEDIPSTKIQEFIFGKPIIVKENNETKIRYVPLKGTYRLIVNVIGLPNVKINYMYNAVGEVVIIVKGSAYGLMGTDYLGRDLAEGLYYGFPVAMMIGVVVALVDTVIGVILGAISGYYGGLVDEIIQRLVDIIGNIPWLPILIIIANVSYILYPNNPPMRLWLIMFTLMILGWGGLTIVIRSMTLSIKSEPYVEAARCLGAGHRRILFLHIVPQVIPYAVASMVFSVPSAILTEAGLSVLGIYHGMPTWGLIISEARTNGTIYQWWWILPPGFLIAITSLTFVLLGMAIERIVEPRLRTR
ncbi:MAG: ABC transporter permease [Staphylothermus sp.]|nr:ABC transporter permease [Staphylothermus sp.]